MTSAVDAVKSVYAGFASGDIGAVLGTLDPAIEWDGFAAVPSEYVSQGAVRARLAQPRRRTREVQAAHRYRCRPGGAALAGLRVDWL
jgi:hypothetical protein